MKTLSDYEFQLIHTAWTNSSRSESTLIYLRPIERQLQLIAQAMREKIGRNPKIEFSKLQNFILLQKAN